jgi:acyl-CoA thioester hydrolase
MMTTPVPAPLQLHSASAISTSAASDWADDDGHLSEWAYLLIFGDNADAFFRFIGVDDDYRAAGRSLFTVETHLRHLRQVKFGQWLRLTLQLLGHDSERLHVLHEMFIPGVGCAATAEQMLVHVCTRSGQVEPFGPSISDRVREIAVAHERLLVPDFVGRSIRLPVDQQNGRAAACSGGYRAHLRSASA